MSTDFLNRRMDLIHTIDVQTVSGGTGNIGTTVPGGPIGPGALNVLTMDTSYPVRLAGKVIKIFTAYRTWTRTSDWVIKNTKGDKILSIPFGKVYDFAGRVIELNVGDGKAYNNAENVYKKGDYVMVIIDFDNATLHLCSETNFSVFITGDTGDKETFKLFDISGEEEVIFNNKEIFANKEAIENAITFDKEEGHYSFVRDNDNVIYQIPENIDDNISAIPVSDVDITNINSFNASCYPLLFPNITTGYRESFEIVDSCRNFVQLSGVINSEFIKNFCYTATELINLPIIEYKQTGAGGNIKSKFMDDYLVYYISGIFEKGIQNDYVYFIRDFINDSEILKGQDVVYKTSIVKQSQIIIPIHIDTGKFSEIDIIGGNKELCNGSKYELNMLNNFVLGGNIVGNWWSGAFNNDSAWVYMYSNGSHPSYYGFMIQNNGNYKLYDYGNIYNWANMGNTDSDNNYITRSADYNNIMGNSKYSDIKKLIDYFSNGDNDYRNYIYQNVLSSNHNFGAMVYTTSECPISIAFMCDEDLYDNIMNNRVGTSLKAYSEVISTQEQNNLKYHSSVNIDNIDKDELKALAFKMLFFSKESINNGNNSINYNYSVMALPSNEFRKVNDKKFKFSVSDDFLPDSTKENTSIIFMDKNNTKVPHMCHLLSRALPRAIDNGYGSLEGDLIADVGITRAMFVSRRIYFVNGVNDTTNLDNDISLKFNDSGNLYYRNISMDYNLYMVSIQGSSPSYVEASFEQLKKELVYNHTVYLYFSDSDGIYYRMRLFVDGSTFATNWATNIGDNVFTKFDYFTEPIMITKENIDVSNDRNFLLYDIAYCNCTNTTKANINSTEAYQRICVVANKYFLSTKSIWRNIDENGIAKFAVYDDTVGNGFSIQTTISLSLDADYSMYYYRHNGTINGRDFKISDLIPENTFTYTDGPAPLLSMTKNKDAFVYNIETYQNFISNVYVADTTNDIISNITGNEGGNIAPLLNKQQLKYINGKGIREEYYNHVSIYDFFRYSALYDLAIPMKDQIVDTNSNVNMVIYNKNTFNGITHTENRVSPIDNKTYTYLVDSNNNDVILKSDIVILCKISNDNRYGFNEVSIINKDGNNVTSNYIVSDKIYASIEKAGNKKVMNIALSNKDNILLNINGILGNLNRDTINWETLLLALSNNKSVDILSNALINTKKSLNTGFLGVGQNVNDTVSIENNDSPNTDLAVFDDYYNVYRYKPNKGYNIHDERIITNRGVIVFVTDNGSTTLDKHGHTTDPTKWTEDVIESEIHAKRMYISKDGLLCTKEYYDREAASASDTTTTIKELEERIKVLEDIINNT